MRVALVYNQRKEDATKQSHADDATEPPSLSDANSPATIIQTHQSPSTLHQTDLYAEWDTAETIQAVKSALEEFHEVSLIEADEDAYEKLRATKPEIVFNVAEGLYGASREALIPAILEMLGIPYTGSDPLTLAICLDKSRAKEILAYHHITTPRFCVISDKSTVDSVAWRFPLIVKPLHEGSSKGVFNSSLVRNRSELALLVAETLERYNEPALAEEYLPGREFTVAMLGNGDDVRVLPIVEI